MIGIYKTGVGAWLLSKLMLRTHYRLLPNIVAEREIVPEYVPYIGVLRQFSIDHDLGIFDAGHDQLTDAAMVDGLVYKPAGAGGGDVGMLFGRDEADLDAFLERRSDLVRGVLPCALDESGVRMEAR